MLIYILEDDEQILEMMEYALRNSGFDTAGFQTAQALYPAIQRTAPDLLLLDLMLPDEDGLSVLQHLRRDRATADLRVIIVSAKSTELDTVRGLDCGADDYITKPFGIMELISRVKAQLRRVPAHDDMQTLRLYDILLDCGARQVTAGGCAVDLTYKEFELLKLLMEHPQQVLTREILMERIWGYDFEGTSRTLDMHIKTLRKKLGASGALIKTVRNVGYKLEGDE